MLRKILSLIPAPNRLAVYLAAGAALAGGLAPVVGNLDIASTAGVVTGVFAIVGVVRKWLDGWQTYEKALYTAQMTADQDARQAAMIAEAGGMRSAPSVKLPR